MKITEKWLKKHHACESAIVAFKKQKETDSLKILKLLVNSKKYDEKFWISWLVGTLIDETDVFKIVDILKNNKELKFEEIDNLIDRILGSGQYNQYLETQFLKYEARKRAEKKAKKMRDLYTDWFKENGFTISKQTDTFGHYFRIDPLDNLVAQMIRYHYDDSSDCYYVKWQMWTGIENKKRQKIYPIPKREDGIEWELETDNERFFDYINGFHKMIEYIKNHSEEKFELMREYNRKRQEKI